MGYLSNFLGERVIITEEFYEVEDNNPDYQGLDSDIVDEVGVVVAINEEVGEVCVKFPFDVGGHEGPDEDMELGTCWWFPSFCVEILETKNNKKLNIKQKIEERCSLLYR